VIHLAALGAGGQGRSARLEASLADQGPSWRR
jgi:hypothetical protein